MTERLFTMIDAEHSPVTEGAVLSSSRKGKISEAAFALAAVLRGWDVIDPGDIEDFDRIIKRAGCRPITVQVKRAMMYGADKCYRINTSRSGGKGAKARVLYSQHAFDVLAAHLADVDRWVFYTRAELLDRSQAIYMLPSDRKQTTSLRACAAREPDNWALLDEVAASLCVSAIVA